MHHLCHPCVSQKLKDNPLPSKENLGENNEYYDIICKFLCINIGSFCKNDPRLLTHIFKKKNHTQIHKIITKIFKKSSRDKG